MGREEESKKCFEDEEMAPRPPKNPTPPDGGWGWMVVMASFFCNMVVDGTCFSFGILTEEYKNVFNATYEEVNWAGSLLAGCYLLVGPVASALALRFGCQKVTIIGSVITTVGFILSTVSTNITMLIVTYGVIGGIGFGFIYLPSIVSVGYWFDKKRAFATGVAVCGSGMGQFVFPPLARYLVDTYDWKGKNLIMSSIALNCVVAGAIFRPIDRALNRGKPVPTQVEIQRGAIMKALIEQKERERTISTGSLDNCIITKDNRLIKVDPSIFELKRNNSFIARFKRQLGFSSQSLACSKNSLQAIPSIVIDAVQKHEKEKMIASSGRVTSPIYKPSAATSLKRGSTPDGALRVSDVGDLVPNGVLKARSCDTLPGNAGDGSPWRRQSQEGGPLANGCGGVAFQMGSANQVTRSAGNLHASVSSSALTNLDGSVISIQEIPNGAAAAAHHRSQHLRSSKSLIREHLATPAASSMVAGSVVSVPQYSASVEEVEAILGPVSLQMWIVYVIRDMFDFPLMLRPLFALLVISSFLTLLAFFIPYFYLPVKGSQLGMNEEEQAFLLSIVGILNTIGRVLAGWLADRPWINSLHLNNMALIVAGISAAICPACQDQTMLVVFSAIFGLSIAVFVSLRSILLVELLGLEKLTKSFGILILFQGIAGMVGAPIAGKMLDSTGNVDFCFYMAGGLIIVSGLLGIPLNCLKRRETAKFIPPLSEEEIVPITKTLTMERVESTI